MKECCICYSKRRDDLFIQKNCCVYEICLTCYVGLKHRNCTICKTNTVIKNTNITSKIYISDVLKFKLPRCACRTNLYRTCCLNKIYPPFNTCILHHKKNNKDKHYYDSSKIILNLIIFYIGFQYANGDSKLVKLDTLHMFYYLIERYNIKLSTTENHKNLLNCVIMDYVYKGFENVSLNKANKKSITDIIKINFF